MAAQPVDLPRRETVLDAVLYLMTKHAQAPCPVVQRAIVTHLELLARYPAVETGREHRHLMMSLSAAWSCLAASREPFDTARACSVARAMH
jgi:hypothetical protein